MTVTGTIFYYFMVCHRKLWLFAHGITMEQGSELVYEGKLIHENSYPERNPNYEEIELEGIKVDFYDARHQGHKGDFGISETTQDRNSDPHRRGQADDKKQARENR